MWRVLSQQSSICIHSIASTSTNHVEHQQLLSCSWTIFIAQPAKNMASLTQLAGPRIDFELIGNVCFGGVVLWMQRERVRKVVWEPVNPYLPPGWFAGVLYVRFHSMSLFLFGITLLWLYFILSLSLSDARCIGLTVSNGRIPGVEQTERLLPQGDIRTMGISPITFFRGSNVFRQEIGWLNLCVYLFPLVFLMIG